MSLFGRKGEPLRPRRELLLNFKKIPGGIKPSGIFDLMNESGYFFAGHSTTEMTGKWSET